jgi:hypothetical protein
MKFLGRETCDCVSTTGASKSHQDLLSPMLRETIRGKRSIPAHGSINQGGVKE